METLKNTITATKENEMIYSDVQIKLSTGELRKPAFADFNRIIDNDSVNVLLEKILFNGFREEESIKIIAAEDAKKEICDINQKPILQQDWKEYFLILDGQHRTRAVSSYNKLNPEKTIQIPGIIPTFKNGESIEQYICDINVAKKPWLTTDYINGAANTHHEEPILQKYKELIKTTKNPDGYPLTTLNHIYTGKGNSLLIGDFQALCLGKTKKETKTAKNIIPEKEIDIKTGDAFIEVCLKAGFSQAEITKRYLITEFNKIRTAFSPERAIKTFELITHQDRAAMKNDKKKLDEILVSNQIEIVKARYRE